MIINWFFGQRKSLFWFLVLPFIFLLVSNVSAQSGNVANSTGSIIGEKISNNHSSSFPEGTASGIEFQAVVTSGHQTKQCPVQGDPWQAPFDINFYSLDSNFGYSSTNPNSELRLASPMESEICTGNPPLREGRYRIEFFVPKSILNDLSPGNYWVQFGVNAQGPINNRNFSWGGSHNRVHFTVTPNIDLTPSLNVSPNNSYDGDRVDINYTVSNNKDITANDVVIEIYDNGNRRYRSNIGNIGGGGSRSGTISRRLDGVGNHNIEIVVDPNNRIDETNENNNRRNRNVDVREFPKPVVSLQASPSSVSFDGSTNLRWTVQNSQFIPTDGCQAGGDWGGVRNKNGGDRDVSGLRNNKVYIIECVGERGDRSTDSVQVNVADAPPPPTINLNASPTHVQYNRSSLLEWNTQNADSCDGAGDWGGPKRVPGGSEQTGSLTNTGNFILTCDGPGGRNQNSVVVTVDSPPTPTGRIEVKGRLDGNSWSGPVSYSLNGPSSFFGSSVNENFNNKPTGTWNLSYNSGGPSSSTFNSIEISSSQTLTGGGTIIFTLNFSSNPTSSNNANLTVSQPQVEGVIYPGDSVFFSSTLSNNGSVSTDSGFNTEFSVDGVVFSTKNESPLEAGSSRQTSSSSWNATGVGLHQIRVCTDIDNSIVEGNESDNCSTNNFRVNDPDGGGGNNGGNNNGGGNNGGGSGGSGNGGNGGGSDSGSGSGGGFQVNPDCSDGVDNDGDGWIDLDDPGCTDGVDGGDALNDGELGGSGSTQCSDGIDNDSDGFIDGNDPECRSPQDNTEKAISFEEF